MWSIGWDPVMEIQGEPKNHQELSRKQRLAEEKQGMTEMWNSR